MSEQNVEKAPVEKTLRFATMVPTIEDAWAFMMSRVDVVGPDPQIHIVPVWLCDDCVDQGRPPRQFSVVVEGMVEEPEPEA